MRQVVVHGLLDECDVRPPVVFGQLVDACVASAECLLHEGPESRTLDGCPACGESRVDEAFRRHGYTYLHCPSCWSLFASPRPTGRQYRWYLEDSPAAQFRRSTAYLREIEPRARELAAHRAVWLSEFVGAAKSSTSESAGENGAIVQIEPRAGFLAEELAAMGAGEQVLVSPRFPLDPESAGGSKTTSGNGREHAGGNRNGSGPGNGSQGGGPTGTLAGCRICPALEELDDESCQLSTAFETLEYQADPSGMLRQVHRVLRAGGHLMLTTRSASGFDIQTLWQHADIFPLEHINLFSVEGMQARLQSLGFEVLEISTPGMLDLQVVRRVARQHPELPLPRFFRYLLEHRGLSAADSFQEFLQQQRLSSYMRVLAKKKG